MTKGRRVNETVSSYIWESRQSTGDAAVVLYHYQTQEAEED